MIQTLRRAYAVLLLAVFSFGLISPLLSAPRQQVELPPCCRKDGKHACGMMPKSESPAAQGETAVKSKKTTCPLFPAAKSTVAAAKAGAAVPNYTVTVSVQDHPVSAVQAEAQYRISFNRSCQKRGPPSVPA